MSDLPPPTPAGVLIRDAREMAIPKRSIPEVAHRVGIDPGTLGNIERGYRHVGNGRVRAVRADPATLAKLARELGVSPERLADDGQRPDAAAILRKDVRDGHAPAPGSPGDEAPRPGSPDEAALAALLGRYPDNEIIQAIGVQGRRERWPAWAIVQGILWWLERQGDEDAVREFLAGLLRDWEGNEVVRQVARQYEKGGKKGSMVAAEILEFVSWRPPEAAEAPNGAVG